MTTMAYTSKNLGTGEKTIAEWNALYMDYDGWYILDADGFDRSDPDFYTRTYTEEEFVKRRLSCTTAYLRTGSGM